MIFTTFTTTTVAVTTTSTATAVLLIVRTHEKRSKNQAYIKLISVAYGHDYL